MAYNIWRISGKGIGSLGAIGLIGFFVVLFWFLAAWYNLMSGGRFVRWLDSSEDEEDSLPEIPASFADIENSGTPLTLLQRAISDGISGRKDLSDALRELDLEKVEYERDAIAICSALQDCEGNPVLEWKEIASHIERPGSARVYRVFMERGLAIAHRLFLRDRKNAGKDQVSGLLSVLRMFVAYGYAPAFPAIGEASRDPVYCSDYRWVSIFNNADKDDPDALKLNRLLAEPLPDGFARIAYLDWSNQWCIESTLGSHPFDSDAGVAALEEMLGECDEEKNSHATSAACAVAFLTHSRRDFLLELARNHEDPNVRLESAWAAARLKIPDGIRDLSQATLDWRMGATARRYMEELGLGDEIPPSARDPMHVAISKMAEWLAHPNELGRFPDSLTVLDQRELEWPATNKRELQTLLHWKLEEEEGISWTGSSTWALFSAAEPGMPLLDLYAMYNSWEMRANDVPDAPESLSDLEVGRLILVRANPDMEW